MMQAEQAEHLGLILKTQCLTVTVSTEEQEGAEQLRPSKLLQPIVITSNHSSSGVQQP